jgi:hypothetical protein
VGSGVALSEHGVNKLWESGESNRSVGKKDFYVASGGVSRFFCFFLQNISEAEPTASDLWNPINPVNPV